jgi:hypothetical protein
MTDGVVKSYPVITLDAGPHGSDGRVTIDGAEMLQDRVRSICIETGVDQLTRVVLELINVGVVVRARPERMQTIYVASDRNDCDASH